MTSIKDQLKRISELPTDHLIAIYLETQHDSNWPGTRLGLIKKVQEFCKKEIMQIPDSVWEYGF